MDKTELVSSTTESEKTNDQNINTRALKSGTVLNDQYEVKEVVGEGGFGITYRAFDKYLKINVAIKEYFPAQFASRNTVTGSNTLSVISGEREEYFKNGLKKYEEEANRLTKFSDKRGIVSVLNFFKENGTAYMVMEFVEGKTLKEYLDEKGGKISYKETLSMMQPVIESFKAVHSAGIIHRDISPDNIIITPEGEMVIIDFGAARTDEDEKSKTIMLKHGYAPPEQYYRNGKQGAWSDVYAICATMFRMISGCKLPDAMSLRSGDVKKPLLSQYSGDIPKRIEQIIDRGTEPNIDDRIKSMDELEHYLYGDSVLKAKKKKNAKASTKGYKIAFAGICTLIVAMIVIIIVAQNNAKTDNGVVDTTEEQGNMQAADTGKQGTEEVAKNTASEKVDDKQPEDKREFQNVADTKPDSFKATALPNENQLSFSGVSNGIQITGFDDNLTDVEIPVSVQGQNVVSVKKIGSNTITLFLNSGVKAIETGAFKNCVYLERVFIPNTVESIGQGAFNNCLSLKEVVVSENNPYYYVDGNTLYSKDGETVVSW